MHAGPPSKRLPMTIPLEQHLARFTLDGGRREELKWLAAILMVVDHVNGYLLGSAYLVMYELGRLAYPLFAMILAYNLASAGAATLRRVLRKLLLFGVIAQPFTMLLRYPTLSGEFTQAAVWWQGNILFTFAIGVAFALVIGRHRPFTPLQLGGSILLAVAGGALVDFRWAGIGYFVSAYYLFVERRTNALIAFILANIALAFENLSLASFLALPILIAATSGKGALRRRPGLFYAFYPLHLAAIWLAKLA